MKKETVVVQDRAGNAVVGAEVYIRDQDDNSLVSLYSDDGVTPTANPVVTNTDGVATYWTANNTLKQQVYVDGVIQQEYTQVQHFDLDNISTFIWTLLDDASASAAATTLGLGTGDSPQFTAVNIGHASDSTITRVSAGVLAIEGSNILTAATGQPLDADLTALAANSTDGLWAHTGAGTGAARTITGTANEISVANGSGAGGNPTLSLPTPIKTHTVTLQVTDPNGSALTTGDGKGYYRVPSTLNGCDLVGVAASLSTVSSSGIPTVQIRNATQTADMLTTKLTIDANETDSSTAANAAVIDAANDDVATGDQLYIDIDVAGTGAKGLVVEMQFRLP